MRDSGDESLGARGDRLVIARREHFARHELRADADGRRAGADEIRDVVQIHATGRDEREIWEGPAQRPNVGCAA